MMADEDVDFEDRFLELLAWYRANNQDPNDQSQVHPWVRGERNDNG
jgi:hypothetical protein